MASIYPKKKSPFWWIAYADPVTGKPVNKSTKLRRDNTEQTRRARQQCAQMTANEFSQPRRGRRGDDWGWVPDFFVAHYPNTLTLTRAREAWFALQAYFRAKAIYAPRFLSREQCSNYLAWRTGNVSAFGLRRVKHNTARVELQFLSAIMREAVLRRKAEANPCLQLGIKRAPGKSKPEITEVEITTIEARLKAEAGHFDYNEAMRIAWDIAIRHVCRISETCVALVDVDLTERTIVFTTKGGRRQKKTIHPQLVPMFAELKRQGRRFAYDMPNNWPKKWRYFFNRCGLPHLSFHSTRVTGVNTLRRNGVDPSIRMDYVGHKSVTVHHGYERFRADDHAIAAKALSRPSLAWSAPKRRK